MISFLPSLRHAAAFAVPTHFSVCLKIAIYDDDLAFLSLIPGRILRRVIPIVPQRIRNTLTLDFMKKFDQRQASAFAGILK